MNRELLRQVKPVRVFLLYAIVSGMLIAITTVAQMVFLSTVVNRVFLGREGLEGVWPLLFLLLGAIVLHSGLLWLREVVTQRGAIRVKSTLRERLFAHLMQLGPGYTGGERTGELARRGGRREARCVRGPLLTADGPERARPAPHSYVPATDRLDQRRPVGLDRPGDTGPDDPDGEPRRRAHEEPVDRPLPDERAFPRRVAGPSHP